MLIKYFIYFCLMVSSLAAQTPLSAIDWLSKEKVSFKSLSKKNTETENTEDIKVSTLASNEYQAIGSSTNLCYWNSYYNLEKFKL